MCGTSVLKCMHTQYTLKENLFPPILQWNKLFPMFQSFLPYTFVWLVLFLVPRVSQKLFALFMLFFHVSSPVHSKSLYNKSLLASFIPFQKYNFLCCLSPLPVELKAIQV